tara:strand:- start:4 stop:225 length:222 start_codon:yes stop_codon:yes gene_type:complete
MANFLEQQQSCKDYISEKYSRSTPFPNDWEADEIFNCICMQEKNNAVRAADLDAFIVAGVMTRMQAHQQLELT